MGVVGVGCGIVGLPSYTAALSSGSSPYGLVKAALPINSGVSQVYL